VQDNVIFTGNVDLVHTFAKNPMSSPDSISEAQPLVILEAGAAGDSNWSTRVGACAQISWAKDR